MNEEERRRITEDGKWPLLKTRPDNLPSSADDFSDVDQEISRSRTYHAGTEGQDTPVRRRREEEAEPEGRRNRPAQKNRQERAESERRRESARRQQSNNGRRQSASKNASRRKSGNRSADGSVGEYLREFPDRFRRFLKNPTEDIPFLIGCVVAVILIILVISLIVRAAVGSGSGKQDTAGEGVTTVSSSVTPTPAPAYTATDVKMSFVGDVLLGMDENTSYSSSFNAFYDLNGADYFLKNVKSVFSSDDLSVINLEGTLTDETARADKTYAFKADPSYVSILSDASIEAADLANDHTSDYGENSYTDTVSNLESAGISHFGNADVAVMNVRGITVGLYGVDMMDDPTGASATMTSSVQKLKEQNANIIIGYFHWGSDQDTFPTQDMVNLAHSAVDAGTNLVVGSGSHLLEGIEYYNNSTIAYGLGSFCFGGDTNPSDVNTIIFQPTFSISNQGTITNTSLNIVPCQMSSDANYNDYQPQILTGDAAQAVLDELDERSSEITQNYADITKVYNSKTDGTAGVGGAGINAESVSAVSSSSSDSTGLTTGTDGTQTTDAGTDTTDADTTNAAETYTTDTTGTTDAGTDTSGAGDGTADTDTTDTTTLQ